MIIISSKTIITIMQKYFSNTVKNIIERNEFRCTVE